jgi:hypothetical protein
MVADPPRILSGTSAPRSGRSTPGSFGTPITYRCMPTEGRSPPPPKAYSRVTNPERFRPLHDRADGLLRRLERQYVVVREEGYVLGAPIERVSLARASVALIPQHPGAAPIQISFTTFPGVLLSFGRSVMEVFPPCGCDACGYTGEEEARKVVEMVEDIVAGRFEEQLLSTGTAWRLWSDHHERCCGVIMPEASGAELIR